MKFERCAWIGVIVAVLAFQLQGPVVVDPDAPVVVQPDTTITAATYVYEKSATAVPAGVSTGIHRLNKERKIVATLYEQPAEGEDVPDQYKVPLAAAKQAGLPALVVTAGDKVVRVAKSPTTEAAVWEAAQ